MLDKCQSDVQKRRKTEQVHAKVEIPVVQKKEEHKNECNTLELEFAEPEKQTPSSIKKTYNNE